MAARPFYLKYRDTRPILEVELHDPPPEGSPEGTVGDVHDLTNSVSASLHIALADGVTKLERDMIIDSDPTTGIVRYTWQPSDWDAGALVVGAHQMECEVVGLNDARLTFPNRSYDKLIVWSDIGQAT